MVLGIQIDVIIDCKFDSNIWRGEGVKASVITRGVDSGWVQENFMDITAIFERVGIQTDLDKTKTMVCTPGYLWGRQ